MSKEREPQVGSLLYSYKPKQCVEVGAETGAGTFFIADIVRSWGGCVLAVDIWNNDCTFSAFLRGLRDYSDMVSYLRMSSVDAAKLYAGIADFVYVDADHSYDGVMSDLVAWSPKIRGVLAGDDFGMDSVHSAWRDFACSRGLHLNNDDQVVWIVL